jgi:hypothetical protein
LIPKWNTVFDIVTRWLEAGILEQEKVAVAKQWHSKHISVAADSGTILDVVFSVWSMPRLYNKDQQGDGRTQG